MRLVLPKVSSQNNLVCSLCRFCRTPTLREIFKNRFQLVKFTMYFAMITVRAKLEVPRSIKKTQVHLAILLAYRVLLDYWTYEASLCLWTNKTPINVLTYYYKKTLVHEGKFPEAFSSTYVLTFNLHT